MTNVNKIHTNFILEVIHEGIEYHVTISEDLKDIYDYDVVNQPIGIGSEMHNLEETALREVIWSAFMNGELDLDN